MGGPRLVLLISASLWGALALMGWDGIRSIADQQVAGYPNAGQIRYYLHMPLAAFALSAALLGLTWLRRWGGALSAIGALLILLIFPYLLPYTGGV